jgi:hypothetical protein
VFDGEIEKAIGAVDDRVNDKATEIGLKFDGLVSAALNVANNNLRESQHDTTSGKFTIYHSFVSTV